uniref:Uncharacterized protein n=1 Tax=Bracon brevicornis TaxID=1563983 RepID=A0A6V7IHS5_9HYME
MNIVTLKEGRVVGEKKVHSVFVIVSPFKIVEATRPLNESECAHKSTFGDAVAYNIRLITSPSTAPTALLFFNKNATD